MYYCVCVCVFFCLKLWSEDAKESPIMWTKYNNTVLTDSCWSPTRPGVFFTSSMDGTLDVWDVFFKHRSPTLTVQVHATPQRSHTWLVFPLVTRIPRFNSRSGSLFFFSSFTPHSLPFSFFLLVFFLLSPPPPPSL